MPKKIRSSQSVAQFRKSRDNLTDAIFVVGQYKRLTSIVKNTVKVKKDTKEILDSIIKAKDKELIYTLFFVYLISILEVYLKDRIVEEFHKNPPSIEKFLKGYVVDKKITTEDILIGPEEFTLSIINNTSFHNLKKVEAIYKIVFGFKILRFGDFKYLDSIIHGRHAIVHRGAIVKRNKTSLNVNDVLWACQEISNFVEGMDYYIRYRKKRKRFPKMFFRYMKEHERLMEWKEYEKAFFDTIIK